MVDRPVRIVMVGSHGAGKSTLSRAVASALGIRLVGEGVLDVFWDRGIGEDLGSVPLEDAIDAQREVKEKRKREMSSLSADESCVCDCGMVDYFSYCLYWFSRKPEAKWFLEEMEQEVALDKGAYTHVFLVPPNIPLKWEGVRFSGVHYRLLLHSIRCGLLHTYGYHYHEIEASDEAGRLQECLRVVREAQETKLD